MTTNDAGFRGWYVLATIVIVSLIAAIVSCAGYSRFPDPLMVVVLAVTIFYCNLVAFWLALGKGWVRMATAVVFVLVVTTSVAWTAGWREYVAFLFFYSGIVSVVGLTGLFLRAFFGEMRKFATEDSDRDALQFGVRHLFILTTLVAFTVATLQALIQTKMFAMDMGAAMIITFLVASISIATIVQIWAFFGNRLTWLRGAVVAVIAIATSCGVIAIRSDLYFWMTVIVLNQALTVSALLCIRFEGYRFVKRGQAN